MFEVECEEFLGVRVRGGGLGVVGGGEEEGGGGVGWFMSRCGGCEGAADGRLMTCGGFCCARGLEGVPMRDLWKDL